MTKHVFKIMVFVVPWLLPAVLLAQAPEPNAHLAEARRLYQRLQFADVVHKLEMALSLPGNSKEQLSEIYALMGTVHVVLENEGAARRAFQQLLAVVPDHDLPADTSPKILRLFGAVKANFVAPARVTFPDRPRITTLPGKPPRIEVRVDDPAKKMVGMDLFVKTEKAAKFLRRRMPQTGDGRYATVLLPGPRKGRPASLRLEYYLQARGPGGVVLARLGSRKSPHVFAFVPGSEKAKPEVVIASTPWYKTWWFWTAVGVLATGAGVGITLGVSSETEVPVGSLGKLPLR